MKVLDLECGYRHRFEGWFGSETDYLDQVGRGMVECPVCGSASITKCLSAPRLNLGRANTEAPSAQEMSSLVGMDHTQQAAWMALARRIVSSTDDVGNNFAEEARKMYYGEARKRGIRGKASVAETESLLEEGIDIMLMPLPEVLGNTLFPLTTKH